MEKRCRILTLNELKNLPVNSYSTQVIKHFNRSPFI